MTQLLPSPLIRIVDDDEGLRGALAFLLENEGYETACYSDARDFLTGDTPSRAGCLILDVRMPGMTGLQLQRELAQRRFPHPIIFLTAFAEVDMAVESLKKGAFDFLQKPVDEEKLLEAVEGALRRDAALSRGLPTEAEFAARLAALSERQRQIIRLVAAGLPNPQIAQRLGIALRTVKFHRAEAYRRLGIHTQEDLLALSAGLGVDKTQGD